MLYFIHLFTFFALTWTSCTKNPSDYPNLKITDIKIGTGETVGGFDSVLVRYVGRFENGHIFDRTPEDTEGRWYTINASTLIQGWKIGLPGTKVGGIRKLIIPPELAYGKKGKGQRIPPNTTLIFEVEVLKVR